MSTFLYERKSIQEKFMKEKLGELQNYRKRYAQMIKKEDKLFDAQKKVQTEENLLHNQFKRDMIA